MKTLKKYGPYLPLVAFIAFAALRIVG